MEKMVFALRIFSMHRTSEGTVVWSGSSIVYLNKAGPDQTASEEVV